MDAGRITEKDMDAARAGQTSGSGPLLIREYGKDMGRKKYDIPEKCRRDADIIQIRGGSAGR